MATKKQRRRREKLQRHEYEYVVENEEGEEVIVETPKAAAKPSTTSKSPPKGAVIDRRGKVMQPPSWSRVLKRGAIFAPILAILIWVTGSSISTAGKILNIVILLAIFIPFSYLVDTMIYRTMLRRQRREREGAGSSRR